MQPSRREFIKSVTASGIALSVSRLAIAEEPSFAARETLPGRHTWATEDGPVVIDVQGDTVMVTESLDEDVTKKMEQELFTTSGGNGRAK